MERKICLINPPTTPPGAEVFFPMALIALGSHLQSRGVSVEIVDFDLALKEDVSLLDYERFKEFALNRLASLDTRIFGISSICNNFPVSLLLAQAIRERWPDSKILLGGHQPSSVPEETLAAFPFIDLVVIGEGEITLTEIMENGFAVFEVEAGSYSFSSEIDKPA